jgi:hypothetical protein
MIREQVTVEDFNRISQENEYYLWHFVKKENNGPLEIQPYFDDKTERYKLKTILDMVDIPFFESYTEDSVDFLINLGFSAKKFWSGGKEFAPIMIGFNKNRKVTSTQDRICYCTEGIIDIVYQLNPKFILDKYGN